LVVLKKGKRWKGWVDKERVCKGKPFWKVRDRERSTEVGKKWCEVIGITRFKNTG